MIELNDDQVQQREAFRSFVNTHVAPFADDYDREERLPRSLIEETAKQGYLGAVLPEEYGGGGMSMLVYGLLNEEIARGCSSLRSLLTVHGMVAHVVLKWASKESRGSTTADTHGRRCVPPASSCCSPCC